MFYSKDVMFLNRKKILLHFKEEMQALVPNLTIKLDSHSGMLV